MSRGQSHVVGVALMLSLSVLALGTMTLLVGGAIDSQAAHADATRVADDFESSLQPRTRTGHHRGPVSFGDGRLRTVPREVRLFKNGSLIRTLQTDALVFESDEETVAYVGGGIVRGAGDNTWLVRNPPLTGSATGDGVLVASVPSLGNSGITIGGGGSGQVRLRTNVSHERTDLGRGNYEVAIETRRTDAFIRYFEETYTGASIRDIDGDDVPSVVGNISGVRTGYLVVHELELEVTASG